MRRLRDCLLVSALSALIMFVSVWYACSLLMRVYIVCVFFSSEDCEKAHWKAHKLTHPSKGKKKTKKVKRCGRCGVKKGEMKEGKKVKLALCSTCKAVHYW